LSELLEYSKDLPFMPSHLPTVGAGHDLSRKVQELEGELAAARRRETATAQILQVISRSRTDIQSVLDTVAESAARLCEAEAAGIFRRAENKVLLVAHHGPMPFGPVGEFSFPLIRGSVNGRSVLDARTIHVADLMSEGSEYPEGSENARRYGHRTVLAVPLLRDGIAVGSISLHRAEARLFTEAQVALLQTFANQAVIAIENTRLFEAEQASKRELQESLEYQIATGEVLGVISRSPTDVQPVFNTIARSAAQLCKAQFCHVFRFDGVLIHFVASHGLSPKGAEAMRAKYPMPPGRASAAARSILTATVEEIPDVDADPDFEHGDVARLMNYRSIVAVPMTKDGRPIGAIVLVRSQAGRFPIGRSICSRPSLNRLSSPSRTPGCLRKCRHAHANSWNAHTNFKNRLSTKRPLATCSM